jgi:membrane associated rhomboid family serine protease
VLPLRDHNRPRRAPVLTYGLIAVNVLVFLHQLVLGDSAAGEALVYRYGVVPYYLTHELNLSSLTTPLTSLFLHGGVGHLLSNMWFLHVFGDNVEDRVGRSRFLLFYLAAGVMAAAAQVLVDPASKIPMVGASGAIAGVLGAYLRLFPRARVDTVNPLAMAVPLLFLVLPWTVELPAVFFIVVWFGFQLLSGLGSLGLPTQGGIAFFAHIGGFLAGLWLIGSFSRRRRDHPTHGYRHSRDRYDYR